MCILVDTVSETVWELLPLGNCPDIPGTSEELLPGVGMLMEEIGTYVKTHNVINVAKCNTYA